MTADHDPADALRSRADRGTPRGPDAVLEAAQAGPDLTDLDTADPSPTGRRWLGAAAVVLVAAAIGGAAVLAGSSAPEPIEPTASTSRCTDLLVYVEPGGTEADRLAIGEELAGTANVKEVRYADQAETYREFRRLFKDEPTMLENVQPEDLPTSFRVVADDATADHPLADLEAAMRRRDGVFEVRALPGALRCDPDATSNGVDSADDPTQTTATPPGAVTTTVESGAPADGEPPTEAAAALAYVIDLQQTRFEAGGGSRPRPLIDSLPNVHFEATPDRPVLDTVVVGEVVDVRPGSAFTVPTGDVADDAPFDGQVKVPFDSVEADWRTVVATVEVTDDLGSSTDPRPTVDVGFVVGPDADVDRFRRGLIALGPAVYFADSANPVFAYDRGVAGIAEQGALVATVGADGHLALPFIREPLASELLADARTLDDLAGAAAEPARTIPQLLPGGG